MKTKDLVVGNAYYCDGSNDWENHGWHSGVKYILRDAKARWEKVSSWYVHGENKNTWEVVLSDGSKVMMTPFLRTSTSAHGLLFETVATNPEENVCQGYRWEIFPANRWEIFPANFIRGDYDVCAQHIKEVREQGVAARQRREQLSAQAYKEIEDGKATLVKMGLPEPYSLTETGMGYTIDVRMSRTQFKWILAQLEAAFVPVCLGGTATKESV